MGRSPLWHIAAMLACGLLLFPNSTTIAATQPSRASAPDSLPSGLVVVIENKAGQALDLRGLSNPSISGVALQIRWRDIESVEGNPDWSKLDQLFAAAESSRKWVQLLIFPGFFAPRWALEGAKTERFAIQYGPGTGTVESLPLPWDEVYLNRWFAFLKRLSARYGKFHAFRVIAAAGPTSVSAEFTLPAKPQDIQKWIKASYTPRKYIGAWQQVFQVAAADFPNQYVSLSEGTGLNINNRGRRDASERARTTQAIVNEGIRLLGRRFALQNSNLDGKAGPDRAGIEFVMGYNGQIVTGFQLRTSCVRNSADMGAEGNPPLALRQALDRGLRPNGAGRHVTYLEIYEPDVVANEMQPVLHYGASLFK